MFRKPPSRLESLRGTVTETVASTFDTIHEKLDDLPLERPLEKLKDVTGSVAETVHHGLEAASHGLDTAAHKASDALHAVTGAARGAATSAKGAAATGIAAGAATAGGVKKSAVEAVQNTAKTARESRKAAQEAAASAAAAARARAQHKVEDLSAAQEKLRKRLEKKLHKEARREAKEASRKADRAHDDALALRRESERKHDRSLPEVQIADTTSKWLWIGLGVLVGVLLGIMLAPTTGRRSRALVKDKLNKAGHGAAGLGGAAKSKATGLANRAAGKIAEIKGRGEEDLADDRTIADRVRTAIGESPITRNMERLNIDCVNGIVTVRGPIADAELQAQIEHIIRAVKGVVDVQLFLLTEETEENPEAFVG